MTVTGLDAFTRWHTNENGAFEHDKNSQIFSEVSFYLFIWVGFVWMEGASVSMCVLAKFLCKWALNCCIGVEIKACYNVLIFVNVMCKLWTSLWLIPCSDVGYFHLLPTVDSHSNSLSVTWCIRTVLVMTRYREDALFSWIYMDLCKMPVFFLDGFWLDWGWAWQWLWEWRQSLLFRDVQWKFRRSSDHQSL